MYTLRIDVEERKQGAMVPRPGASRDGVSTARERPQSAQQLSRTSLPERGIGAASTSASPKNSSPLQQYGSCGRLYAQSGSGLASGSASAGQCSPSHTPALASRADGDAVDDDLAGAEFHDSDFEEDPPAVTTDDGSELIEFSAGVHDHLSSRGTRADCTAHRFPEGRRVEQSVPSQVNTVFAVLHVSCLSGLQPWPHHTCTWRATSCAFAHFNVRKHSLPANRNDMLAVADVIHA